MSTSFNVCDWKSDFTVCATSTSVKIRAASQQADSNKKGVTLESTQKNELAGPTLAECRSYVAESEDKQIREK
ncbi:unnamed protein product [Caenorhabditis nigoni]